MFKKIISYFPGMVVALVIALVAKLIADSLPIHLISASVVALFIGMIINSINKPNEVVAPGIKFTSKMLLKFAIILLGASLNITTIMHVGSVSLFVMLFTLLTCFGGGHFIGKALKLNWKMSNLISAGTGICGGSAIAAIAPAIDAEDIDIAFSMSATFLFDMVMIVLFPIAGHAMGLSDVTYGLWSGTAVNDTSSVVAAGYAFSEAAGDFAVMVKLTRTLAIIPTVIIFTLININLKRKHFAASTLDNENVKIDIKSLFPWFIVGFLAMALMNSFGVIPVNIASIMKELSKFLMIAALAAIGLNTSFKEMRKSGVQPMLHGFIISALVVIVAFLAIWFERMVGLL
ncbi:MAG: putative sulfate exporter family transporter [Lachnospiraceae bacterium]|nr:putative sulfate exporter family transporter [Lachnospiraceae bacterium]